MRLAGRLRRLIRQRMPVMQRRERLFTRLPVRGVMELRRRRRGRPGRSWMVHFLR